MQEHGCAIEGSTSCPEAQWRSCATVAEVEEFGAVVEDAPRQTGLVAPASGNTAIPNGVYHQRGIGKRLLQRHQIAGMLELQYLPASPVFRMQHLRGTECPRVRRRAIDDEDGICPLA